MEFWPSVIVNCRNRRGIAYSWIITMQDVGRVLLEIANQGSPAATPYLNIGNLFLAAVLAQ